MCVICSHWHCNMYIYIYMYIYICIYIYIIYTYYMSFHLGQRVVAHLWAIPKLKEMVPFQSWNLLINGFPGCHICIYINIYIYIFGLYLDSRHYTLGGCAHKGIHHSYHRFSTVPVHETPAPFWGHHKKGGLDQMCRGRFWRKGRMSIRSRLHNVMSTVWYILFVY